MEYVVAYSNICHQGLYAYCATAVRQKGVPCRRGSVGLCRDRSVFLGCKKNKWGERFEPPLLTWLKYAANSVAICKRFRYGSVMDKKDWGRMRRMFP